MEVWKDVVGYEGLYQVSDLGNVRSLYFGKKKILKSGLSTSGYLSVNLHKDKKQKIHMIHRLVYEAFVGIRSCRKMVIDHIDNEKSNNKLSNLQYISNRENSSRGKKPKTGENNIYLNSGSYLVRMRVNSEKVSIGTFKTIEEAVLMRDSFLKEITSTYKAKLKELKNICE
jgi:hypothetical protein